MRGILHICLGLFLVTSLFNSCRKIPNDGIPSYIRVDSVIVLTSTNLFGSASHNISNVWVDVAGENMGTYEVPVTFPVLNDGKLKATFQAGIRQNGIGATRIIYPFYLPDTVTLDLLATQETAFIPNFEYVPGTDMKYHEDFDFLSSIGGVDRVDTGNVFEGPGSGLIYMDTALNVTSVVATSTTFDIPTTPPGPVFIELDYRNDAVFSVGMQAIDEFGFPVSFEKVFIPARDEWNKIYINVSEEVNFIRGTDYQIRIETALTGDKTKAHVYLDNIKLLHF